MTWRLTRITRAVVVVRLIAAVGDGDGKDEESPRWIIMRRCSHSFSSSVLYFLQKKIIKMFYGRTGPGGSPREEEMEEGRAVLEVFLFVPVK